MSDNETDKKSVAGHVDYFETISGDAIIKIQSSLAGNHPFLKLIGRVASEWTHFENILDEIIIELSGMPEDVALCITRNIMGATGRFKMIEALGNLKRVDTELLKQMKRLKNEQYETAEKRNRIVHDPWFTVADGGNALKLDTKQLKAAGYEPVTELEITTTIDAIKKLIHRAAELQIEFRTR